MFEKLNYRELSKFMKYLQDENAAMQSDIENYADKMPTMVELHKMAIAENQKTIEKLENLRNAL